MLRESLIAASLIAAPAAAHAESAAHPFPHEQVVKIGILDTAASNIIGHDGKTSIKYREFARPGMKSGRWRMENGHDHGEVMANVFVSQIRSIDKKVKIEIYSANITEMHPTQEGRLLFNPDGAREALKWFADNGVKTVMTTMVGKDSESMKSFMSEVTKLNMTLFASAGNQVQKGVPAFPAAYPQSISISGDGPSLALRNDPSVAKWVNFTMDGSISLNNPDDPSASTEGSSMAVTRASAIGAYAVYSGKAFDRDSTFAALKSISEVKPFKVKDASPVFANYIDRKSVGLKISRLPAPGIQSASLQMQRSIALSTYGR